MKKIIFIAMLTLIYAFLSPVNIADAAFFEPSGNNDGYGVVILAEATGDFFGDGRDVKVEMLGNPLSLHEFIEGERTQRVGEADEFSDDILYYVYMDGNRKIEDGARIIFMQYYLRVTNRESGETQYSPRMLTVGSSYYDFKICDIDGDKIPEVFYSVSTGGSGGGNYVAIVSLKGGQYGEIFSLGLVSFREEDYEIEYDDTEFDDTEYDETEYDGNSSLPTLEAKLLPGFLIQFTAQEDGLSSSWLLDIKNSPDGHDHYADEFFTPDGNPREDAHYEPYVDDGFSYEGVADIDGDGRDEIYGAFQINGNYNADNVAYINVAYKRANGGWKACFISITSINDPLGDMPGVKRASGK